MFNYFDEVKIRCSFCIWCISVRKLRKKCRAVHDGVGISRRLSSVMSSWEPKNICGNTDVMPTFAGSVAKLGNWAA